WRPAMGLKTCVRGSKAWGERAHGKVLRGPGQKSFLKCRCTIQPAIRIDKTQAPKTAMSTPITVSIVEDNRGTRNTLSSLLKKSGGIHCVSVHETGEEALQGIPKHKPSVVLMEINLPGMSGIECVERLKKTVIPFCFLLGRLSGVLAQDGAFDGVGRPHPSDYQGRRSDVSERGPAI